MIRTLVVIAILASLLAVSGCKEQSGGSSAAAGNSAAKGATATDECASATAHAQALREAPKGLEPEMAKYIQEATAAMITAMTASCQVDAWKPEVIGCFGTSKVQDDLGKCLNLLSPAQKASVDKAVTAATSKIRQPGQVDPTEATTSISSLRDRMCACKDKACAEALEKEWGIAEGASEGARHDAAVMAAWKTIDDEYSKCRDAIGPGSTVAAGAGAGAALSDAEVEGLINELLALVGEISDGAAKGAGGEGKDCKGAAAGMNSVLDSKKATVAKVSRLATDVVLKGRADKMMVAKGLTEKLGKASMALKWLAGSCQQVPDFVAARERLAKIVGRRSR